MTFDEVTGHRPDKDRRAIEIERIFGLFRTYGFNRRPDRDNATPLEEGDREFVCLEAFSLGGKRRRTHTRGTNGT
jgi:hypothetical protein